MVVTFFRRVCFLCVFFLFFLFNCYKVSVEKIAVEFFSGFSLFHAQAGREIKLFYFHSVFCTVKTWA